MGMWKRFSRVSVMIWILLIGRCWPSWGSGGGEDRESEANEAAIAQRKEREYPWRSIPWSEVTGRSEEPRGQVKSVNSQTVTT